MKDAIAVKNDVEYEKLALQEQQRASQVFGFFRTVSSVPTYIPANFLDQIVIYRNGNSVKLYAYDVTNKVWRPVWMGDLAQSGTATITQTTTTITIGAT